MDQKKHVKLSTMLYLLLLSALLCITPCFVKSEDHFSSSIDDMDSIDFPFFSNDEMERIIRMNNYHPSHDYVSYVTSSSFPNNVKDQQNVSYNSTLPVLLDRNASTTTTTTTMSRTKNEEQEQEQERDLLFLNGTVCDSVFDRDVLLGRINCECTKEIDRFNFEVKCEPVQERCGILGQICGKVQIIGTLKLFNFFNFLKLKFCFGSISILNRPILNDRSLCIGVGPNILALILSPIGVPTLFIRILLIALRVFLGGGSNTKDSNNNPSDEDSPIAAYQDWKKHGNSCEVTIGDDVCESCTLCDNGQGVTFSCANIDPSIVSSSCTSVLDGLNAGIQPIFD